MQRYDIEVYETEHGDAPFQDWVDGIKDANAKTRVMARIGRAALGNFGDWKSLTGAAGLCEMRIDHGPGLRVFYSIVGQTIVLILAGSTKREQDRTIAKAVDYLADYKRRVKQ